MLAAAALDQLLRRGVIVAFDGPSYPMRDHQQRAEIHPQGLRRTLAMTGAEQRAWPPAVPLSTWTPAAPRQKPGGDPRHQDLHRTRDDALRGHDANTFAAAPQITTSSFFLQAWISAKYGRTRSDHQCTRRP
jgi:hypothetical protein